MFRDIDRFLSYNESSWQIREKSQSVSICVKGHTQVWDSDDLSESASWASKARTLELPIPAHEDVFKDTIDPQKLPVVLYNAVGEHDVGHYLRQLRCVSVVCPVCRLPTSVRSITTIRLHRMRPIASGICTPNHTQL